MIELPKLKDWKTSIEDQLKGIGYSEEELLRIVYLCEDYIAEMTPALKWVNIQNSFLQQILGNFRNQYTIRFGKDVPPRPKEALVSEVLLDDPNSRKRVVREVALAIAKPGDEVSDETVLEELKCRGMRLVADNPTATISTILNGFKTEFEKVKEKRGVFKRIVRQE